MIECIKSENDARGVRNWPGEGANTDWRMVQDLASVGCA